MSRKYYWKYGMIELINKSLNRAKLKNFGFEKRGDVCEFSTLIVENQLRLVATIDKNDALDIKIFDNDFGEEYNLHLVESAYGTFVGLVREEYKKALESIVNECYESTYEMCSQKGEILDYVYEKYGISPCFPFEDDNETTVLKEKNKGKWFAIIMNVKPSALGIKEEGQIDVINVKIDPDILDKIVDNNKYFRAYHMNKKLWTSLILDGRLSKNEIEKFIDDSYNLVVNKNIKKCPRK